MRRQFPFLRLGAVFPLLLCSAFASEAQKGIPFDRLAGVPEGERIELWPTGRVPQAESHQYNHPFIEWFVPSNRTTRTSIIVTCGGGYGICNWCEVGGRQVRDYFLDRGMTVIRFHHRTPRPRNHPKYLSAWQDVQRAIRLVRAGAEKHGIDPEKIGMTGYSAAGHLTLLAATSALTSAYDPVDDIDKQPCHLNWAVPLYPAYMLTDGLDGANRFGGNRAEDVLAPEFKFDKRTCPVCFFHGDADVHSPLGSVKTYMKLHRMGVPCEMHILATRGHDFFSKAEPGTPSATWKDRIWEWLVQMHLVTRSSPSTIRERR